jgi:hypothetical protein
VADTWSDERLDAVLGSIGEHLVVPPAPDVAAIAPRRSRRPAVRALVAAGAAALAIVVAATTINPVQDAIAEAVDWLGIGSTRVERAEPEAADPRGLPAFEAGLPRISASEAERLLGRPLPASAPLGPPAVIAAPPEGGVLLGWDDGASLWVRPSADPLEVLIQKVLDEYDTAARETGLGDAAVSVIGDHVLTTPHRRVAADSVVLWVDDGYEYRLEADAGRTELVTTAHAIRTR